MASWPRDILPSATTAFVMPGALQSWAQSGKAQHRSTTQVGRIWSETYPPFKGTGAFGRKLVATINNFWRNGSTFDIDHYLYLTHNGSGTGTPTVNGAGQSGSFVALAGWTGSNPVMKAGDLLRLPGIQQVFDLTADAPNLSGGTVTLSINPPIFVGTSPTNGAAIGYTAVRLNAKIFSAPDIPGAGPDEFIGGLSVTFREAV